MKSSNGKTPRLSGVLAVSLHIITDNQHAVLEMVAVKNFFVWMLIAWVASGPSALAWHHALEHSGISNHSAGCCSAESSACSETGRTSTSFASGDSSAEANESCNSSNETPCPFGFSDSDAKLTDSHASSDTSLIATSIQGVDEECRICEILLHSDVAVYGNESVVACDVVYSPCDEVAVSRPFKQWFGTWSVRGPPSC